MSFETIFPGHYEGRATHTHLLTKSNVTLLENSTTSGGAVTHIGQLFWPEDLISEVETFEPYNTNTVERTSNDDDMWSIVQADNDYDPFPEFVYLGDSASDGLLAWIQIGINSSADHSGDDYYSVAATYYEGGGVANANSGFTGGNGTGPGNGTMPSGAIPSGAIPSGAIPTDAAASTDTAATTEAVTSSVASATALPSDIPSGIPSGAPRGSGMPGAPHGSGLPSGAARGSGAPAGVRPSGAAQPSGRPAGQQGPGAKQSGKPNKAAAGAGQQKQGPPSGFSTSALPTPRV